MRTAEIVETYKMFLARFVARGWLAAERDDAIEQAAVAYALSKRWVRKEGGEVQFTAIGQGVLAPD